MTNGPDGFVDEPDEWAAMTPQERWTESTKLWHFYLAMGVPLIPNPIHRVLSTLRTSSVQFLLSGGQACILYGGTEFSRDADRAYWLPLRRELERMRHDR